MTPYALTYGHPAIDGTLATWGDASIAGMVDLSPDQVVGIPGWTPQNLSARIYTMWDEQYFYLAADVQDETFDYAPIGYNMYKGDSIQYGWGMDSNAYLHDAGPNRYNVTTGLTHAGPANFQYNLLTAWPGMRQDIKPDPTTGHLIYTTAIPWANLGQYVPKVGAQFAFNLLINQTKMGHGSAGSSSRRGSGSASIPASGRSGRSFKAIQRPDYGWVVSPRPARVQLTLPCPLLTAPW